MLIAMGVLCGATYEVLHIYAVKYRKKHLHNDGLQYLTSGLGALMYYGRLIAVSLAPISGDIRVIRLALAVDAMFLIIAGSVDVFGIADWTDEEDRFLWAFLAADAIFVAGVSRAMCLKSAGRMKALLWRTLAAWIVLYLPISVYLAIGQSRAADTFSPQWLWVLVQVVALMLIFRPSWQQRLRHLLTKTFEARSSQCAAAGVAGLVGNCSPREALLQSQARFRCLPLSDLDFEELADNSPNPALFAKTVPCKLRGCDAFVSHSWHDDAAAKWAALQRWREDFVAEVGREPLVWIDKCCIDQRNIEEDLRCLPIFLSGCRRMIVFCGPTYLSRLWCMVELFTYVHMGGKVSNIHFEPVYRSGHEDEDLQKVYDSFGNFDACACSCFLPEDKERMLGVITAAFGDIGRFNLAVKEIFERSHWRALAEAAKETGELVVGPLMAMVRQQSAVSLRRSSRSRSRRSTRQMTGTEGVCVEQLSYSLEDSPGADGSDDEDSDDEDEESWPGACARTPSSVCSTPRLLGSPSSGRADKEQGPGSLDLRCRDLEAGKVVPL